MPIGSPTRSYKSSELRLPRASEHFRSPVTVIGEGNRRVAKAPADTQRSLRGHSGSTSRGESNAPLPPRRTAYVCAFDAGGPRNEMGSPAAETWQSAQ
eukprot:CAMPEP_0118967464 /NCGR_PEP_ID=MMETSP1173-20130426/4849_1 /TAXON_ID=1034831 /ORGANISM="Rhizochromulina marina cf, Strain CCMP1243" /LENGTH=97 /DNA_ID=CAMNT_0006916433 /DNA_START=94 /DNA_END=388 /DNA_ORIENTATION=+